MRREHTFLLESFRLCLISCGSCEGTGVLVKELGEAGSLTWDKRWGKG